MTSTWYITLVALFLYLPLVGFAQDNSTSLSEKRSDLNVNMISLNLTNASTLCNLQISDSAIENIVRLMHIHTTNVVEIEVSIDSRNRTRIFKWPWASEIGRTIISLTAHPTLVVSSWQLSTLTRGILKAQVVVSEENYGCLPAGNNGSDHVFDFLLHQLSRAVDTHDYDHYKLCRPHNDENNVKQYSCCRVANDGKLLICADYSSLLLEYADNYLTVMTIVIFYILLPLLLKYTRSFRKESDSYEITYSPMALSSIFHVLFFYASYSPVISCYRRLTFSVTVALLCFIRYSSTWFRIVVFIWVLPFTFFDIFRINVDDEKVKNNEDNDQNNGNGEDNGKSDKYDSYLAALTLPFNFKFWWNTFNSILQYCNCNPPQQLDVQQPINSEEPKNPEEPTKPNHKQPTNPELSTTCAKQLCCDFTKGLCFVLLYLSGLGVIIVISLGMSVIMAFRASILVSVKLRNTNDWIKLAVVGLLQGASTLFIFFSVVFLLKLLLYLIAGLYLNVEFYSPIVVPTVGLIVYSWKHWRLSVETEYLQLKTQIYDVWKELGDKAPNDSNPNSGERNGPQHVDVENGKVSKALYEEIREKNLPYHKVLFNFFARMLFVANFFLIVAVMMLLAQKSGISGPARIMSTLIVSTFPFFFDAVWVEHTSQQADANQKKLDLELRKIIKIRIENTITLENEEDTTNQ